MIRAALIAAAFSAQLQEPGPDRYDPVCDGREASKAELYEHRLRELQEWRRDMGMPASRKHIAALLRSKAAHERSQKLDAGLDGPVTEREYRYLKAAAEIDPYELTMPYFKGARRAYYYGVGIEDDWPRGAMLGVYVTRNVVKVQRDLTRWARGKYRVKVVRVRYSLRELQRIQKSIDWQALEAEGIKISSTGIGDNEVHVDASSARPDAKAVIEQRYGKAVKATVDPPPVDREICIARLDLLGQPGRPQAHREREHERLGDRDADRSQGDADHGQRRRGDPLPGLRREPGRDDLQRRGDAQRAARRPPGARRRDRPRPQEIHRPPGVAPQGPRPSSDP